MAPSKSQILGADPHKVLDLIDGWKKAVETLEQQAETYKREVDRPGGSYWEGATAEAAQNRAGQDYRAVVAVHDSVCGSADKIRNAISSALIPPLNNAKQIIANAEANKGVTVNEDLSISYSPPPGTSEKAAEANKKTIAAAETELKADAAKWWAAETDVAQQIRNAQTAATKQLNLGAGFYDLSKALPHPGSAPAGMPSSLQNLLLGNGAAASPPAGGPSTLQGLLDPGGAATGQTQPAGHGEPQPAPGSLPNLLRQLQHPGAPHGPGSDAGADSHSTHSPLSAPIVAADPSVIAQQAARVEAARQTLAAAQAKLDAAAAQTYTKSPGAGPGREVTDPVSQAVFDARRNLTEQTNILNDLNKAAPGTGARPMPAPPLPPHADVQAFPPQPSIVSQAAQGLSEASHDINKTTFGLVPDVAHDLDVATHWGQHSGADHAGALLDGAGFLPIPGAKILGEGLNHALGALGGVTHHLGELPTPHLDGLPGGAHLDPPPLQQDTGGIPGGDHHMDAPDAGHHHVDVNSGGTGAWNYELNHPQPNTHYTVDNRFQYTTDHLARPHDMEANLNLGEHGDRSSYQQRIAGGDDRLPDDHGGHIFGSQFGGPGEAINLTAMSNQINLIGYAGLESEWKNLLQQGYSVDVKVNIDYPGDSMRPDAYFVKTYVDGKLYSTREFDN